MTFSQVNRRTYVVSDPIARENLKQQIVLVANEVNALQEEKKMKKISYDSAKEALKEANDDEENYKKQLEKVQQNVFSEIESILSKNHIEKPV